MNEIIGVIGIIVMIFLLLTRIWIGVAMGLVGFLGFVCLVGLEPALTLLATVPYGVLHSYDFTPVPMFVLMGVTVGTMGIGEDLFTSANKWVGQFRGGLTYATTLACAAIAAIAGSSLPALVTMGKVAVPEMKKYNYDLPASCASLASAGTLGILIPPSMGFILYSLITNQSVAKLFIAGILPGILLTCLLLIAVAIVYKRNPGLAPKGQKATLKEKIVSLRLIWPTLLLFVMVIGGMYAGIITATEGGAIGSFGAIVISAIMGRLTWKNFIKSILEAAKISGMIAILMVGGFLLMKFIAVSKLPFDLALWVQGMNVNRYLVFTIIIIMYILMGMFLDIYGAVVLTVPILYPLVTGLGFDPIWFGVIAVIVIEMGLVTPPIGLNVFTLSGIVGIPSEAIFYRVTPYVVAMLVCIVIITIFPEIALLLPNLM